MANTAPRAGITYEQVANAATSIQENGVAPTIRNIREAIGGSPNTIHKHLTTWRFNNPAKISFTLNTGVANLLAQELSRIVEEACAATNLLLEQGRAEAKILAATGEGLEFDLSRLEEKAALLTREKERLIGKTDEQFSLISRLSVDLAREIRSSEQVKLELSLCQNKVDQQAGEICSLKETIRLQESSMNLLKGEKAELLKKISKNIPRQQKKMPLPDKKG